MEAKCLGHLCCVNIESVCVPPNHSPMVAFATLPIVKPLVRLNLATTSPTEGREPVTSVFVMDFFFFS